MLNLFAQNQGPPPEVGALAALIPLSLFCCEFLLIIAISSFQIYYIIVQFMTLNAVSPRNRDMEPGMVFLMFVPLLSIVWYFIVVSRLATSLEKEFRDRDLPAEGDFGYTLGLWAGIMDLTCCLGLAGLVCHIIHMFRLRKYLGILDATKGRPRGDWDRDRFDEDDSPPPSEPSKPDEGRFQE